MERRRARSERANLVTSVGGILNGIYQYLRGPFREKGVLDRAKLRSSAGGPTGEDARGLVGV